MKPKIYMFTSGNDGASTVAEARDAQGVMLAEARALNTGDLQDLLMDRLFEQGITMKTHEILVLSDLDEAPELVAAMAAKMREEVATQVAPRVALAQHRAARAREHLCPSCGHESVCVVADAMRRVPGLACVIASCLGHEPPAPANYDELLAQLEAAASEPAKKPPGQG